MEEEGDSDKKASDEKEKDESDGGGLSKAVAFEAGLLDESASDSEEEGAYYPNKKSKAKKDEDSDGSESDEDDEWTYNLRKDKDPDPDGAAGPSSGSSDGGAEGGNGDASDPGGNTPDEQPPGDQQGSKDSGPSEQEDIDSRDPGLIVRALFKSGITEAAFITLEAVETTFGDALVNPAAAGPVPVF